MVTLLRGAGVWIPLAYLVLIVARFTLAYLAVHPVISRLRELRPQSRSAAARQARALLVMLLPLGGWLVILQVARPVFSENPWAFYLLATAWLLVMVLSGPSIIRLAMRTRPMPEQQRAQLDELCRRHGVRVRDFRMLDTGPERTATAAVAGFFARMRYVFVSDRLLEQFTAAELDAVVAHELGHAKQHHLPIKLGVHLLAVIVLGAAWVALIILTDPDGAVAGVLMIGFLLLQQHPGLEDRIERLDQLSREPSAAR